MNIEKLVLENQAKALQQEIDKEVLWSLYVATGYTRVELPRDIDKEHSQEIVAWLRENTSEFYEKRGASFLFKDEKDAMWFKLRWLG